MRSRTRFALGVVAALAVPLGAAPDNSKARMAAPPPSDKAVAFRPPAAKLHIKTLTIVSPVCGKPVEFRLEVQNLSSGAFGGSTNINNKPGAVFTLTDTATKQTVMEPLKSIAGGATLSQVVSLPTFVAACPGQACWEAALLVLQPDFATPDLPEWDGVKPRVCLKQSCAFEVTGPFTR
jgi:hypothetical protein